MSGLQRSGSMYACAHLFVFFVFHYHLFKVPVLGCCLLLIMTNNSLITLLIIQCYRLKHLYSVRTSYFLTAISITFRNCFPSY